MGRHGGTDVQIAVEGVSKYKVFITQGDSTIPNIPAASTDTVFLNMDAAYGTGAADVSIASDTWTCPKAGTYCIEVKALARMYVKANASRARLEIVKNGTGLGYTAQENFVTPIVSGIAEAEAQISSVTIITLALGDQIKFRVLGATGTGGSSQFQVMGIGLNDSQSFITIEEV